MRMITTFALVATLAAGFANSAVAQKTYSVGTNKQGSLSYSSGTTIAKLLNQKAGILARVKPGGGSSSIVPQLNAGKVDFAINNPAESRFAYFGTGTFKGRPHPNFRLVGVMYPLRITLAVPFDSKIKRVSDAKGLRMGYKFTAQTILQFVQSALLANGGLKQSDMQNTPYSRYVPTGTDMARGKLDIAVVAPGSGGSKKQHAMLKSRGGIRFLSIDTSPAAIARMNAVYPEVFPLVIKPSKRMPGVIGPTTVMAYPFFLTAGAHVPDDIVYKAVKAMYGNKEFMAKSFGAFNRFDPRKMRYANTKVPYHSGAEKFYKEMGLN